MKSDSLENLIIGFGIAGINIAMQLHSQNKPFTIIEAQNKNTFHGRLVTYKTNVENENVHFELGASIFHTNQKNINWLIHKLNLSNEIIKYKRSDMYIIFKDKSSKEANEYFKQLEEKLKHHLLNNNNKFINYTLDEASKHILSSTEYNDYKTMHYEWFEHFDKNCIIYFKSLEKEGDICSLKNGMESIINSAYTILKEHILFDHITVKISESKNKEFIINCKNQNPIYCKNLFLCTNLNNKIKYDFQPKIQTKLLKILNWCNPKECIRFYAYFNKELSGLPNYIVGDHIGKFSIKINKFVWLIAYTDDQNAIKCNSIEPKELIRIWIQQMNQTFHTFFSLSDVSNYFKVFWKEAYCSLKPEFYSFINNKNNNELFFNQNKISDNFFTTIILKGIGEDIAWCEANLITI